MSKTEVNIELKPEWNQILFYVEEHQAALKNHLAYKIKIGMNLRVVLF